MIRSLLGLALSMAMTVTALAQSPAPSAAPGEDPDHTALRVLRDAARAAFDKKDFAALEKLLHPDVVFTWQNNEVGRKPAGVRAYYEKMTTGPSSVVKDLKYDMVMDELSIVHGGDAAVGFGKLNDTYTLMDGSTFKLDSRFTVTSVKLGDRWVLASVHASTNPFDNGFLDAAVRKGSMVAAGAGAAVGLLIGGAIVRVLFGRK